MIYENAWIYLSYSTLFGSGRGKVAAKGLGGIHLVSREKRRFFCIPIPVFMSGCFLYHFW